MSVRVAIPILYASLRLHLEKGRQWNVVEHILLARVARERCTAAVLAQESNMPWRLVMEVMIRLMRVGWVELHSQSGDETKFTITASGLAVVEMDSLPKWTRPISRWASFAIDQISGTVYRAREFPSLYTPQRLRILQQTTDVIVLPQADKLQAIQPSKVIETLLGEDEEYKNMDPNGARPVDRFAIVTVVGDIIDGLPARSGRRLRAAVLTAAGKTHTELSSGPEIMPLQLTTPQTLTITFGHDDLILGGPAHEATFHRILKKASSRIVIHSTFIHPQSFRQILPLIEGAAKRGVRIDIMWGKADDEDGTNSTADAVSQCRAMLLSDIVKERVRLHGLTTQSHAKIIVADNGADGLVAVLGSCNWLSSPFKSFEVSAYLRDPIIVAEIADKLATMAMGSDHRWTPLARDLACLASNAKNAKRPKTGIAVQAALVLGANHNDYVLIARDQAQSQITVASHRFSPNAETLVLMPARAAVEARDLSVNLYYGKTTGTDGGSTALSMVRDAQVCGMRVENIFDPRLHAKFLAWDNDSVVITSQNWLSCDPPDGSDFSEIGVYLSGSGLAKELVDRMRLAVGAWS